MHFIRDNLAVCGYHHIGRREEFESHGFRVQLQCTEHYDPWLAECIEVMTAPFPDGLPIPQELFVPAQEWLAKHWDSGSKILISCAAGQSRSVTMAIALIHRKGGLDFLDAANEVISRVPGAYPHPDVLASAARLSGRALGFAELQSVYAAIRKQPPYPWSLQLLQEAASRASR